MPEPTPPKKETPPEVTPEEVSTLQRKVEELTKRSEKAAKDFSDYKAAVGQYPEADRLVHWMQKGQMPERQPTPSPKPNGEEDDLERLIDKAIVEGDGAAYRELKKIETAQLMAKVREEVGGLKKETTKLSQETAVERFFTRTKGVDPDMLDNDSPFWEFTSEYLGDPQHKGIELLLDANPKLAMQTIYDAFVKKHGDPLEIKRKSGRLDMKRGMSAERGVDFSTFVKAKTAEKGRRLSMREIFEAREAAKSAQV